MFVAWDRAFPIINFIRLESGGSFPAIWDIVPNGLADSVLSGSPVVQGLMDHHGLYA